MRKGVVFIVLLGFNFLFIYGINYANEVMFKNDFMIYLTEHDNEPIEEENPENPVQVEEKTSFNGESIEAVGKKIERLLKKTNLEGMGEYISRTAIRKSVNPYLIGGIILESTNCRRDCSVILKQCNNVSGMKGDPGCFGGTYKKYNSIEDGINDLVNDISSRFETSESQVPNKMFKSYGKNATWAFKVSKFMEDLKKGK